jgi:phosphonate transport system substrate-binding protein
MPISPTITLEQVTKRYAVQHALEKVTATIHPGEFVCVIGKSGAGKTTLLRCLACSTGVTEGVIRFADQNLATLQGEDITGRTFAFNDPNSTSGYLVPMTFFLMEMGVEPKEYFSKLMFSGAHEASILAVANKKVDVASTNLPDIQQMTREGKFPRGAVRMIWVSKLIPNDPVVVRKDLPDGLKQAIQQSLVTMKARNPEAFVAGGAWIGGFVKVDDTTYQIIRDLNETAKRLAALK